MASSRRARALGSVLAESAPAAPAPAAEAAPAPEDREPLRVARSTLDLPYDQHTALQAFAGEARGQLATRKAVRPQHVVQALVRLVLRDEQLRAAVVEELRRTQPLRKGAE